MAYDSFFVADGGYSTCGGVHLGIDVEKGRKRKPGDGRGRSLATVRERYRILQWAEIDDEGIV